MTTTIDDILSILKEGERISYPTLLERLKANGHDPRGMMYALDDPRVIKRWANGQEYSWMDIYDGKCVGPLYIERIVNEP